jgi:subtilisin family serine protease
VGTGTLRTGKGVIALVIDTGIDWMHTDFRWPGTTKSRILSIWDQTDVYGSPPSGFRYGSEYDQDDISSAIARSVASFGPQDLAGHGTHVASIMAGNGAASGGRYSGIAPEADLIVVKAGNGAFSDATIIDALAYGAMKSALYGRPIVVNLSLGSLSGAHDGTSALEMAIDEFVKVPGRAVVVAAGNDGSQSIHMKGEVTPEKDFQATINVPTLGSAVSEGTNFFFLESWLEGNPEVTVTLTSPEGLTYSRLPGTYGQFRRIPATLEIFNYWDPIVASQTVMAYAGNNYTNPLPPGQWTFRLSDAKDSARVHLWITNQDFQGLGAVIVGGDGSYLVGSPGSARGAVTVGSHVSTWTFVDSSGLVKSYGSSDRSGNYSLFSSAGPTRDERNKPNLTAPGEGITAALSSALASPLGPLEVVTRDKRYVRLRGTSMSAPIVAGTIALLFEADPRLTSEQVAEALRVSSRSDDFSSRGPVEVWGSGKLDARRALTAVEEGGSLPRRIFLKQDDPREGSPLLLGPTSRIAVRFVIPESGRLVAVQFVPTFAPSPQLPPNAKMVPFASSGAQKGSGDIITIQAYSVVDGMPADTIGAPLHRPLAEMVRGIVDLSLTHDLGIECAAGTELAIVFSSSSTTSPQYLSADSGASTIRTMIHDGTSWKIASGNARVRCEILVLPTRTFVEMSGSLPAALSLAPNFPNPFNASTRIQFGLSDAGWTSLTIIDVLGREVVRLIDDYRPAGEYSTSFDAASLASGVYFYRLSTSSSSVTRKMLLLR